MEIKRAVITAAAPAQRDLPLQRVVDLDGRERTCLHVVLEETLDAGVEQIAVVVCPGDAERYRDAAGPAASHLTFIEQSDPRGYGDALLRAADFTGDQPFLHLVSDHLYVAADSQRCARQLVDLARRESCAVSAVQPTRENLLPYFGVVGGQRLANRERLYEVERVVEKPTPTEAEHDLIVPGLRAGHYLCLFGMHVLTPAVMQILEAQRRDLQDGRTMQLSPALSQLAGLERYLALQLRGKRYNIGVKYGLLYAQLALGLAGRDRDEILSRLVEMLAREESGAATPGDSIGARSGGATSTEASAP